MKCTVLGAGSFGITLAKLINENDHDVSIWEFDKTSYNNLIKYREEKVKLPGYHISEEINILNNINEALTSLTELVIFAIPTQFVRSTIKLASNFDFTNSIVVNVAKGIETSSLKRVSEILFEENKTITKDNYVMFSGPSHAEEIVKNIPTTIVAASNSSSAALTVQQVLSNQYLRVYVGNDILGVELAGALKNVIALAAGIIDGLGFGDNTKGALLTRGMVEITRLGVALGAKESTFSGLSGMGDLITTCISKHSRNRTVGEAIGKGNSLESILATMSMVAEGVETTRATFNLAKKMEIEMPITEKIYSVLFESMNPNLAIKELMERELKKEGL